MSESNKSEPKRGNWQDDISHLLCVGCSYFKLYPKPLPEPIDSVYHGTCSLTGQEASDHPQFARITRHRECGDGQEYYPFINLEDYDFENMSAPLGLWIETPHNSTNAVSPPIQEGTTESTK